MNCVSIPATAMNGLTSKPFWITGRKQSIIPFPCQLPAPSHRGRSTRCSLHAIWKPPAWRREHFISLHAWQAPRGVVITPALLHSPWLCCGWGNSVEAEGSWLSAGLPGAQLLLAQPVFAEDDLLLCSLLPRLCVNRNNRLGLARAAPAPFSCC